MFGTHLAKYRIGKTLAMRILLISFIVWSVGIVYSQKLPNLNCDAPRTTHYYAGTSIVDGMALGGYSSSENKPVEGADQLNVRKIGVQLYIDQSSQVEFQKHVLGTNEMELVNGHDLYLVNNSDSTVSIPAQDSRLKILAEAFVDGKWYEIERFENSWCGNSYHTVYFRSNEYWKFSTPVYEGAIQTNIRYKIWIPKLNGSSTETGGFIYSNSIKASINKTQIVRADSQTNN